MALAYYYDAIIIGGGAAGFFSAIQAKTENHGLKIIILEAAPDVLGKVKISGGGRCNVMHACFDIHQLVDYYPRGQKALKSVFQRFGPTETEKWFLDHGVQLKAEADRRMFPTSNQSQTIIDVLLNTAIERNIEIQTRCKINTIERNKAGFKVISSNNTYYADKLLLATGSSSMVWKRLEELGHHIISPVPSLFTFKINDQRLNGLQGISFPLVKTKLKIPSEDTINTFKQEGPLLITHWGLSGPVILKLSSWAARALYDSHYQGELEIDLVPHCTESELLAKLKEYKQHSPKKLISNLVPVDHFPKRYWESLLSFLSIDVQKPWGEIPDKQLQKIMHELKHGLFKVNGKGIFKDEFVTAGGVDLKEIDLKTMESKRIPNMYLAGEIIDVDALTGGFNFQNAWSTGWLAGTALASQ